MDRPEGLSESEAKSRFDRFGPNKLPEKPPPSSVSIFLSQFKNPLVYVLFVAGSVTLFLAEYSDAAMIFFVVLVNSVLGFVQEKRANSALQSLKSLVQPEAEVYRDGKKIKIGIEKLVPGDIVELEQGEKVPADGRIIKANRLFVEEAILTGESVPVEKRKDEKIYMGTIISSGEVRIEVTKTGSSTEIGKIALDIQKPTDDTPLTKQLKKFSKQLTKVIILLTVFVFSIGLLTGKDATEMFETSVALAVSSIPEGLLVALTVVLAVGMQRILKKKGLVRSLVSAETLGGVTTICFDKTGTITTGKLSVVEEHGDVEKICYLHFESSDDPIVVATRNWLKDREKFEKTADHNTNCKLIDSIPFKAENRFYATLIRHGDGKKNIYVSGAPEYLLKWSKVSSKIENEIQKTIDGLTMEGKRVIGIAKKNVDEDMEKISDKDVKEGLSWVGLLVFSDPVRKNIGEIFEKTKAAGIRTILITGDYPETAVSVMKEIGVEVKDKRIITGSDLDKETEEQVSVMLKKMYEEDGSAIIFARTRPEQKLKVINALKKNKEVVAMMGDGVNDAPALHKADIGVVVGDATDVAKESADLILLDSSFETIVEAIKEGRSIFNNIRKVILFLMSGAYSEIISVIGAIIAGATIVSGLPLPITASQILWINVVSDGFPHLALTVDPKEKNIMERSPRSKNSLIVTGWMRTMIVTVSLISGIMALAIFIHFYSSTGDLVLARSVTFATLGVNSLIYVFSIRTLRQPFWVENPFNNKWLNLAVILGLVFQFLPFTSPALRGFFELAALSWQHWLLVFAVAIMIFFIIESAKFFFAVIGKNRII